MSGQMSAMWKKKNPSEESTPVDVEWLKSEVGKQFPFYDTRIHEGTVVFFIRVDEQTLEDNFNQLRQRLGERGFIPLLRYEGGEHRIYIIQKPKRRQKPLWTNLTLLIATVITTILTGSLLHIGASDLWSVSNVALVFAPENLLYGAVFFSLPLMSILLIHEMGHYFISKRHGIATSLPYFLPIPPILPGFNIGTFGALISSSDPMPNKKALFDVGISGPLAGFLVAIPVTIIGIVTSELVEISEVTSGEPILGTSLLFLLLVDVLRVIPEGFTINLNAIAFAGWIGLLITSINLLPAGQLDGGHIFRAVLGEKQKYAGWIAVFIMIFTGWTFFAIIIVFVMGMMHPPPLNDDSALDIKRKLLFFVALAILLLCFIPFPIFQI